MVNRRDLHIRQLIWAEYRAGRSEKNAYSNLNKKLGLGSISKETIDSFYQRFQSGNSSLFDTDSLQYGIPQAIQTFPNGDEKDFAESIFLTSNSRELATTMLYSNGRFAILFVNNLVKTTLIFADLFHGEIKEVPITPHGYYGYIKSLKMIGQKHLLMGTQKGLFLLKVNYEIWKINAILRFDVKIDYHLHIVFIDQLDPCRVFIYLDYDFFVGSLVGDEIVFNLRKSCRFGRFHYANLVGNKMYDLRFIQQNAATCMWKYRKIDLNTLIDETTDVPITFKNDLDVYVYTFNRCCQVGTRVYVLLLINNIKNYIYAFNTETLTWTDTGIVVYGCVPLFFANQNEILTVHTFIYCKKSVFYRFSLKKPDLLKNLVWLTIRRYALLFNSDLYDRIRPRLSYGCGLRSFFISDLE